MKTIRIVSLLLISLSINAQWAQFGDQRGSRTFLPTNKTARLALSAQVGDHAVQNSDSVFILKATPSSTNGNWRYVSAQEFGTSILTPFVIGGSATTSDLSLQTTSGVGEAGADMHFLVGNNGATEAMTILNNGRVGVGQTAPGFDFHVGGAGQRIMALTSTDNDVFIIVESDFSASNAVEIFVEFNDAFDDGNGHWQFGKPGGTTGFGIGASATLGFAVADALVLLEKGGNFGIGTTDPVNLLNVDGAYNYFADSSSVNDSWGFSTTGLEVLTTGMTIFVNIAVANTDGATLQINALGAKTVHKLHNQALVTGDVEVGQILHLVYDGTEFQMLSQLAQ